MVLELTLSMYLVFHLIEIYCSIISIFTTAYYIVLLYNIIIICIHVFIKTHLNCLSHNSLNVVQLTRNMNHDINNNYFALLSTFQL